MIAGAAMRLHQALRLLAVAFALLLRHGCTAATPSGAASCSEGWCEAQLDPSLHLLQRAASIATAPDMALEASGIRGRQDGHFLKARNIQITFYNDSECTVQEGAEIVSSAEADYCSMEWNFTCGCEINNKVLLATRYDSCVSKQVVQEAQVPVGLCVPGTVFGSSANTFMIVRDMQSCPCCGATCTIYGDPHITVFDQADISLLDMDEIKGNGSDDFETGDFWLVKSDLVQIQGRYRKVHYPLAHHKKHSFLTDVAVGGPFLKGNILRIQPSNGEVEWASTLDQRKQSILEKPGVFTVEDLIEAHYRPHGKLARNPQEEAKAFYFHLPSGVKLVVNRFAKHIDLSITMSPLVGGPNGMDGQCGNFNGNATDDTARLIAKRLGGEIPDEDLLFEKDEGKQTPTQALEAVRNHRAVETVTTPARVAPVATVRFYSDSECTQMDKSGHETFTIDADHCELGFNFTCTCSEDSKAVVATTSSPSCENSTLQASYKIPAGECMDGTRYDKIFYTQGSPYFVLDGSQCPSCCDGEACTVHGDPHITVFDQNKVELLLSQGREAADSDTVNASDHDDMFGWGDFWLIKSDEVLIQARYRKVFYPNAREPLNHTYLTALAVSGKFLQDNKLIVESRSGKVTWTDGDGKVGTVLAAIGDNFTLEAPDVSGKCREREALVPADFDGNTTLGLDIYLPGAVKLSIDRFAQHIDARVRMPRSAGGPGSFDGQCGNFNGDPDDDTAELIDKRIGYQVPDGELLFDDDSN